MGKFPKIKQWLNESENDKVIVLYPGGFKPMTGGHLDLITRYSKNPNVKEVRVIVGPKTRNGISQELGVKIAKELTNRMSNVTVETTKYPSPLLTAYKAIEEASPGKYALGASSKGEDYKRVVDFTEQHQPGGKYNEKVPEGVSVVELAMDANPAIYPNGPHKGEPISASTVRQDIIDGNVSGFASAYPGISDEQIREVWDMLQGVVINESVYPSRVRYTIGDKVEIKRGYLAGERAKIIGINDEKTAYTLYVYSKKGTASWFRPTQLRKLEESLTEGVVSKVNKHMTHAEDLVILSGKEGMDWVLTMMWDLYQDLKGNTDKKDMKLSVKIDGAPAIFAYSKFPGLPDYGIAMKGLFAKTPKVYTTAEEINVEMAERPDLGYKLKTFIKYLKDINIPPGEIWQGDFLFDDKSIQETEMDGEDYWAFHPNTIYYVIPKDSDLGKLIDKAEVGITWHTRYTGPDLQNVQANYDAEVSELKIIDKMVMTDPYIKSFAGIVNFTEEESADVEDTLEDLIEISKNLGNSEVYKKLLGSKDLVALFAIYQNSLIKANVKVSEMDPDGFVGEFIEFLQNRGAKEADKRKSEKGKDAVMVKFAEMIDFIEQNNEEMYMIVHVITEITRLKEMFVKKLNKIGQFQTYLKMKEGGLRGTNQEGFAVSDIDGNVVKLVDRGEFSWSNFSPDVQKGWQ